jgi:hypothetical protein
MGTNGCTKRNPQNRSKLLNKHNRHLLFPLEARGEGHAAEFRPEDQAGKTIPWANRQVFQLCNCKSFLALSMAPREIYLAGRVRPSFNSRCPARAEVKMITRADTSPRLNHLHQKKENEEVTPQGRPFVLSMQPHLVPFARSVHQSSVGLLE